MTSAGPENKLKKPDVDEQAGRHSLARLTVIMAVILGNLLVCLLLLLIYLML